MNQPASKSTAVDSPDNLVGRTLDGRFRIVSALARGGMGAVYRAEQLPLGRAVAIKVLSLRHDEDQDPEFRKRFLLEASTAAKLTHPNTVRVFDYGQTDDGLYFIAMELLEGLTLKEIIARDGALDPERAIEITKQIARSLREAHRIGIVHRDMKPGNVMLVQRGGDETVKVLDFGLAKETTGADGAEVEDITQTGVFMGSPKYMSPEQIQGEKLDARSDLYSVGVILYEMLAGKPPFQREQPMQVLMDHIREIPKTVAAPEGREPLPLGVVHVTMRCLAKVREERWNDMDQFLLALKEAMGGPTSSSGQIAAMTGEWDAMKSGVMSLANTTGSGPAVKVAMGTPAYGLAPLGSSSSTPAPMPTLSDAPPARAGGGGLVYIAAGVLLLGLAGGGYLVFGRPAAENPPASTLTATHDVPTTGTPTTTTTGTTVPTTTTTADPTPPPETEAMRTVLVSLRSQPAGATVTLGDRSYGPTPTEVELTGDLAAEGAALHFVFSRPGFRDLPMDMTVAGGALDVNARLVRIVRGGGGAAHEEGTGGATGETHVEGYRDSPY